LAEVFAAFAYSGDGAAEMMVAIGATVVALHN
jgi:hypothetical protein